MLLLYKTSPEDLLSKRIVLVDYGTYIKHEVVYFHFPFPYIFFYVAMIATKTLVMQHFWVAHLINTAKENRAQNMSIAEHDVQRLITQPKWTFFFFSEQWRKDCKISVFNTMLSSCGSIWRKIIRTIFRIQNTYFSISYFIMSWINKKNHLLLTKT